VDRLSAAAFQYQVHLARIEWPHLSDSPNHHATYVQGDLLIERSADVEPLGQMMRI
jgi:hypothetical protein